MTADAVQPVIPDVRALSVELENKACFDSIPTIERIYDQTDSGAYRCAYSREMTMGQERCEFVRRDPVAMWRHIHFGPHGNSFGQSWRAFAAAWGVGR